MPDTLIRKIETKKALIGVIGLGYVGLPLAMLFSQNGFRVRGFDVDQNKIERLSSGDCYIKHIPPERLKPLVEEETFLPVTGFSRLNECDCVILCVPTPLTDHHTPDLSFVEETGETVLKHLTPGQAIVLESTTYPGTTRDVLLPILQSRGAKVNRDFFLVFSPEREDPGNPDFHTANTPKIVGGVGRESRRVGEALYRQVIQNVIVVSDPETAEAAKLVENIFRSVNIAMVNELKMLFDRMGINIWEVIDAAATKPFGFMPFYPGPGLGGHCIPIDPFYLTWRAKEYDFPTRFIELAGEINTMMPYYVVEKLQDALDRRGGNLSGGSILILGIAYKRDVDDMRESPALKIMDLLLKKNCRISYHDPWVPRIPKLREYDFSYESIPLNEENLKRHDAVVIVTDHSSVDYDCVVRHASLVVDTRNATSDVKKGRDRIVFA